MSLEEEVDRRVSFRSAETFGDPPYYLSLDCTVLVTKDGLILEAKVERAWLEPATVNKNPDRGVHIQPIGCTCGSPNTHPRNHAGFCSLRRAWDSDA